MISSKTQLILYSINKKCIKLYTLYLIKVFNLKRLVFSVNFLPKKRKIITFLKSPHVNKKAQEHFCLIRYKILFNITKSTFLNEEFLLNKPNSIKVKLILKGR